MYDERQLSMNALAKQYNVSKMTISLIVRRETWKHLVPGCEDEILHGKSLQVEKIKIEDTPWQTFPLRSIRCFVPFATN